MMQRILCSMTGNEWFSSQFLQTWSEGGKKEKKNCILLDLAGKFIDYLDTISGRYLLPISNQFSSICTIPQKPPKVIKNVLKHFEFQKKVSTFQSEEWGMGNQRIKSRFLSCFSSHHDSNQKRHLLQQEKNFQIKIQCRAD